MCAGQLGSLLPHMAFAALIPRFATLWGLSATESGAISGAFFLGYAAVVALATTLTDRIDARRILIAGSLLSAIATVTFAALAHDFWSALLMWAIAQLLERLLGWQAAFVIVGCGPLLMLAVAASLPAYRPTPRAGARLLDFHPVIANRPAMGFVLGYGAHCFELAAVRAWIVSFWLFTAERSDAPAWIDAIVVSVVVTLLAMPASILGNELALRIGRRRLIAGVMIASALAALGLAIASGAPWLAVLALLLLHGIAVPADSGSLTSGMVGAADPHFRGATMALHSTVGFGASFVGPLAIGLALDFFGGAGSADGWRAAYLLLGLTALAGLPALRLGVWAAERRSS